MSSLVTQTTAQLEGAAVLFMFSGRRSLTNQEQQTRVYSYAGIALVHSYVCLWCGCVGGWMGGGDLRPPIPVICKSYEL